MRIAWAGTLVPLVALLATIQPNTGHAMHPPPVPPPLVATVPTGRCYAVEDSVPVVIRVHGVPPGKSALASAHDTADVWGKADAKGAVRLALSVPTGVPSHKPAAAMVISVYAPDAAGNDRTATAAVIIGTRRACAALRGSSRHDRRRP